MEPITLYHTAYLELPAPDIHYGRKNADFGQGFYLTPEREFAERWARGRKDAEIYVNAYALDPDGLRILQLKQDEAWFDYIFQNRTLQPDRYAEYDVIIGPIANDTIFNTFGFFTSGLMPAKTSLRLLRLGPRYTQAAIKSARAADHLRWLGAQTLDRAALERAKAATAAEEEQYLRLIAEAMEQSE